MVDPKAVLIEGAKELESVLAPSGFIFILGDSGKGSGGPYCRGDFVRGGKKVELSFRWSLGDVAYYLNDLKLSHTEFLRVQGVKGQYPGFSDDPLEAFRHLSHDIELFGTPFLSSDDADFRALVEKAAAFPTKAGFASLDK